MKNPLLAGLVVAPLFLTGCANTADQNTTATETSASAQNQVTLKITGMT